jgi:hypothetical protein
MVCGYVGWRVRLEVAEQDMENTVAAELMRCATEVAGKVERENIRPDASWMTRIAGRPDLFERITAIDFNSQYIAPDSREYTSLSDSHLYRLSACQYVKRLDLSGNNRVTDDGMNALGRLCSLEHLCIAETAVTDRGMGALARLRHLSTLDVSHTAITDDSLIAIEALPELTTLRAVGTRMSARGIARVRDRRPTLRIVTSEIPNGSD